MPELPEVQTVISGFRPHVLGKKIVSVDLRRRDIVEPASVDLVRELTSRHIADVSRHGKKIILHLDNANRFVIHLGMSGHLSIHEKNDHFEPHTHVIFQFEKCQLRFVDPRRFGGITWLGDSGDPTDGMGPDAIAISALALHEAIKTSRRPIKSALLDQSVLAGVGNIYADESLHRAGIHPMKFCNRLKADDITRLRDCVVSVLEHAVKLRGSSVRSYTDSCGKKGSFQDKHLVYDRVDEPCNTCRTKIKRIVLGGRSTHFCPKCQKR